MIKHYINYNDGIYYIEKDGVIVMSIELKNNEEIKVCTPINFYEGPVTNLSVVLDKKD